MSRLKIASLNTRGLNNKLKRRNIFNLSKNYDIICLQETYITDEKAKVWQKEWPGKLFFISGTNHSKGQIILVNNQLKYNNINLIVKNGRILGIDIEFENHTFSIYNV